MITIQSGKLLIPENERFVGFAGDNQSCVKEFFLSDSGGAQGGNDGERLYTLYLRFDDGRVTSAPLEARSGLGGLILTWTVRSQNILKPGIIMAQIKTSGPDGAVSHTSADYFVAAPSAEHDDEGGEIDMLSRSEFEERMAQAVRTARATAPYIGEDGYWYVYSPAEDAYVRSCRADAAIVDSAVSDTSANPVENRAVKAYIDAGDALKVDKSTRIAGNALSGNISADELYESLAGKINPSLITVGVTHGFPAQYGRTIDNDPVYCAGLNRWVQLARAGDVPSKTSDLTNDSGFLTAHQDISGKMDHAYEIQSDDTADVPMGQVFKYLNHYYIKSSSATPVGAQTEIADAAGIPSKISDLGNDTDLYYFSYGFPRLYVTSSNNFGNVSGSSYDPGFRLGDVILHEPSGALYKCTSFQEYTTSYGEKKYNYGVALMPFKTSKLTNDAGFLTSHQDISGKENVANKVTSVSDQSTDTQYPSAKCVYDAITAVDISGKEDKSNKVTTVGNSSSTTEYPSVNAMTNYVANYVGSHHQDISGKADLTLVTVPANGANTAPDLTAQAFTDLPVGQAFFSVIAGSQYLYIKVMNGNIAGAYRVQPDISGKVDKTRTIAGIDLQSDITAASLKNALSVPVNTSDLTNDSNFVDESALEDHNPPCRVIHGTMASPGSMITWDDFADDNEVAEYLISECWWSDCDAVFALTVINENDPTYGETTNVVKLRLANILEAPGSEEDEYEIHFYFFGTGAYINAIQAFLFDFECYRYADGSCEGTYSWVRQPWHN